MKIEQLIFYSIDKSIKSYRQLAQQRLSAAGIDLTVDQWLVLNVLRQSPKASQQEISDKVFKDNASVTRIIDLLVSKGYLKRSVSKSDRRKSSLEITGSGKKLLENAGKVVKRYRRDALKEISGSDLKRLHAVLKKIILNCSAASAPEN